MNLGYNPLFFLRLCNILRIDTCKYLDVTVQERADFALQLVQIYTSTIDMGCIYVKTKCLGIYYVYIIEFLSNVSNMGFSYPLRISNVDIWLVFGKLA